jgi:hypothetical protein
MANGVTQAGLLQQRAQAVPGNLKPIPDLHHQVGRRQLRVLGFRFRDKRFDRRRPFGRLAVAPLQQRLPGSALRGIPESEPGERHNLELKVQRLAYPLRVFPLFGAENPLFFLVGQVFTAGDGIAHVGSS